MPSNMNSLFVAGLASLAMATTITITPDWEESAGFELVAVVTNPITDLTPSINFWTLSTIHVGAGQAIAGLSCDSASVWYLNGTETQVKDDDASLLTDAGTPLFPSGLDILAANNGVSDVRVDAGPGTPGVGITQLRDLFFISAPGNEGTYLACQEAIPYYQGKEFVVLKQTNGDIPEGCAEIRLFPQCAELQPLPKDALSSHEYAMPVPCHPNVEAWQTSA